MNVTAIGKSFSCSAKNICRTARNLTAAGIIAMTPVAKAEGGAIYNSASHETSSALTNVLENLSRINAGSVGKEISGSFISKPTTATEFAEATKGLTNKTSSALADVQRKLAELTILKPNVTVSSPTTPEKEFAEAIKGLTNKTASASLPKTELTDAITLTGSNPGKPQTEFTNTYAVLKLLFSKDLNGPFTNVIETKSCPITPFAKVTNSAIDSAVSLNQSGTNYWNMSSINHTDKGTWFRLPLGSVKFDTGGFFKTMVDTTEKIESSPSGIFDRLK